MFNKKILISILLLISTGLFAQNSFVDKPVAIVKLTKTDVISQKKLAYNISLYEQQAGRALSKLEKEQVLQTLINQMLVYQAAERDNVTVSDEQVLLAGMNQMMQQTGQQLTEVQFKQIIKEQSGMDYETYAQTVRDQLILEKYVSEKKRDFLRTSSMPGTDEVELFYRQNEEKFLNPEMVKFSHIFFSTRGTAAGDKSQKREQADEVYQQIVRGNAKFEEMVRKYSDDKASVVRDGDIGNFIDRGEKNISIFGRDFLNTLFDLEIGKMSDVLESSQGYHIVIVNQHHKKTFLDLDDPVTPVETTTVRQYISNIISYQKKQKAFQQAAETVVKELTEEAEVQTFQENIQ
ncbi:peptidylprolyl isomerase [Oceanispirochaeta sp.]|uniref:peptidylprolyl isomerase n=1 Tax=Oceanispirochaeta sp. TaxID=2035350 RepID=UPI00260CE044|nr:peptidylprolyl isomerase [Oceanispirochaeta sp.]MDA3957659.1 peptidylprolyl isomerase [Oceanispirochaeta sp.]